MFPLGNSVAMALRPDPNDPERDCAGEASAELPISSPEELGAALRRSRKALGLTQAEVALAAGVCVLWERWKRASRQRSWVA